VFAEWAYTLLMQIYFDAFVKILEPVTARKTWYRKFYTHSIHWKTFTARMRKLAGFSCSRCGKMSQFLDCHHVRYDHLWHETKEDIVVLCRQCHKKQHKTK
jgi:hypothetical protein